MPPSETAILDEEFYPELPQPRVTIALGGRYAKISLPGTPPREHGYSPRGPITRFSKAARKRLIELFAQVDRTAVQFLPLFITLTYPAEYPNETATCKRHLDSFCKRLIRSYPHAAIVWKMEYQKRGAPHFHLLVWNVYHIRHREVSRHWYEVVGSEDKKHLAAGTRVERVKSWHGVTYYAAKYLGKVGEAIPGTKPGRFWGVYGRAYLPIRLLVRSLAWQQAYSLRRALWAVIAHKGHRPRWKGRFTGATVYMDWEQTLHLIGAM